MSADRLRIWDGDEPPRDLHDVSVVDDGRAIPPWLVPILVVGFSDTSPVSVRVLRQGDSGTTPKPNRLNGPKFMDPASTAPAEGSSIPGS